MEQSLRQKRIYEPFSADDGTRVLVDRLWPRGVRKENAHVDLWLKDVAPSAMLRSWFGHDPARFEAFRDAYLIELQRVPATQHAVAQLMDVVNSGPTTLLYAARDPVFNHVAVLQDWISEHL